MSLTKFIELFITFPELPTNIEKEEGVGTGRMGPVIGEGNCAFRSIIQSLILNACATSKKKQMLVQYLREIYSLRKDDVKSEHGLVRVERNISDDDFEEFIAAFLAAKISDGSLKEFYSAYFPHRLNHHNVYEIPNKDKIIKFMACCLRKDVVIYQLENGKQQAAQDLLEDKFFCLDESATRYFLAKGIDLIVYEDINIPGFEVLKTGEDTGNELHAKVVFDRGLPNQHGDFNNGHYYVALTKSMLLDIDEQPELEEKHDTYAEQIEAKAEEVVSLAPNNYQEFSLQDLKAMLKIAKDDEDFVVANGIAAEISTREQTERANEEVRSSRRQLEQVAKIRANCSRVRTIAPVQVEQIAPPVVAQREIRRNFLPLFAVACAVAPIVVMAANELINYYCTASDKKMSL